MVIKNLMAAEQTKREGNFLKLFSTQTFNQGTSARLPITQIFKQMESIDKNDAEMVSKKNHIDISDKEKILSTLSQLAMSIEISGNPIKAEVCLWQYINDLLYSAGESSLICLEDGIPFHDGKSPVCIDRNDYDECQRQRL